MTVRHFYCDECSTEESHLSIDGVIFECVSCFCKEEEVKE